VEPNSQTMEFRFEIRTDITSQSVRFLRPDRGLELLTDHKDLRDLFLNGLAKYAEKVPAADLCDLILSKASF
jgi:hypothetical protein